MFGSKAWSDNNPGELLNLTLVQSYNINKEERNYIQLIIHDPNHQIFPRES